jgi:hypothetical protein
MFIPFWVGALNRVAAIAMIWAVTDVARRRHMAEEARRRAAAEIKILQGLIPICSSCKAIRLPSGQWQKLETYLYAHSEARLTHSLCPPCADKFLTDLDSVYSQ